MAEAVRINSEVRRKRREGKIQGKLNAKKFSKRILTIREDSERADKYARFVAVRYWMR
jgi:hypothetical protein